MVTEEAIERAGRILAEAARAPAMVRLRDCLPPLGAPVDVIVMSDELVERRSKVPGTMVYAALRESRLIAES